MAKKMRITAITASIVIRKRERLLLKADPGRTFSWFLIRILQLPEVNIC
jgi:hypothetical protein